MRAEEAEFAISKIAAAAQRASKVEEKLRLFSRELLEFQADEQALLMHTIGVRAAEDPACGQLLLLLADVNGLRTALGPEKFERLRQALGGQPQGAFVERHFRNLSGVDPGRLPLLRAKTAITLQTVSMLNDRLESQRLPPLKLNGYELAERVLSWSGLEDTRVGVELSELGSPGVAAVRDVLLEADFEEQGEDRFETRLTDEQIKVLGQALGLGRALGRGGATLSEALAQRQGLVMIRRFCLLCRSATMYPPDHPSLPPAFEAFRAMIEQTIEGREQITLTVLTGDILLDDVKIRKEERLKKTFVDLFDERQVASLTFRPGITVDEVKALVYCFTEGSKAVKDSGGVRTILARKNVTNIVVDQFRYRVVADDGTLQTEAYPGAPGDRLLESLIYTHVLEKLERGGGAIQSLSIEEVGSFFRDLLTSPDEDKRRALARLLITLDPGLLDRGFLANPELRQSLSWSAARKALDLTFRDLADGDHETKDRALDTIAQLTDLAIARTKETTVSLVAKRLIEYIATQETDPDLLRKATAVYATLAITYLRRRKLDKAASFVNLLWRIARGQGEVSLGQDERAPVLRLALDGKEALLEAAREGLAAVGREEDVVDLLIQAVADPDTVRNQPASGMLESLGTDVVVTRLFRLFLDQDRSVRSRAYRLLKQMGRRSLPLVRHEIEERKFPTHPGRDPSTGLFQEDSEWYILRNCMDLLAEMDPIAAGPLLADMATDPDHRVRRESLRLIGRHSLPGGADTLRNALADPKGEVREVAVAGLGMLRDEDAVGPLIDLVYRYPEHRKIALEALGHVGSVLCVDFLLTSLDTLEAGARRRRGRRMKIMPDFPADRDAILQAVAALGAIGGSEIEVRLDQFVAAWSSPFRRWSFRSSLRGTLSPQEFLGAAENALALARRRQPATAPTPDTPRSAPSEPGRHRGRSSPAEGRHAVHRGPEGRARRQP